MWCATQNWEGSGNNRFYVYIVLVEVSHALSSAIVASVSAVTKMQCGREGRVSIVRKSIILSCERIQD